MRFFITGASSFIGIELCRYLSDNGHEVIAMSRRANEHLEEIAKDGHLEVFSADMHTLPELVKDVKADVFVHLAWAGALLGQRDNQELQEGNISFSLECVKLSKRMGCQLYVDAGSQAEYGIVPGVISEDTPCNPITPYGIAKNCLRQLTEVLCKQKNKKFMWLRGFYIVGNSKYGSSIFSKITAAEAEKKMEFPFTFGQNQFDFIDYEDFCEQVARSISQDTVLGVINICSGYPEKLADRVERFINENGYKIKLKYGAFPDRPYDSKAIWGDGRKIEEIMK